MRETIVLLAIISIVAMFRIAYFRREVRGYLMPFILYALHILTFFGLSVARYYSADFTAWWLAAVNTGFTNTWSIALHLHGLLMLAIVALLLNLNVGRRG